MTDWLKFTRIPNTLSERQENIRDMYEQYLEALETTKDAIANMEDAKFNYILNMARNEVYTEEDKYPMDDNEVVAGYKEYIQNLKDLRKRIEIIIADNFEYLFKLQDVKQGTMVLRSALRDMVIVFVSKDDFMKYCGMIEKVFDNLNTISFDEVPYLCNFLDFHEMESTKDFFNVIELRNSVKYICTYIYTETTTGEYILMKDDVRKITQIED